MKPIVATLVAIVVAGASAVVGLPQPSDICCFGLNSTGLINETVKEDHVGALLLGDSYQQGGFYDGGPGTFYACSVGVGADKYYNIFSALKPDKTNCVAVSLSLYDPTSGCLSAINSTAAIPTVVTRQSTTNYWSTRTPEQSLSTSAATTTVTSSYSQVTSGVSGSTESASTTTEDTIGPVVGPTHVCSVSPSSPSLAPIKLNWFDKSNPDHPKGNSANVSIIPARNTTFLYNIPQSFHPVRYGKRPLCGLQFRMPYCTELPKGYPCYHFTGMEQEELAESGMHFDLIIDDGQATWNGTELHQIYPGEQRILGTFECGAPAGSYAGRQMSWSVSSVHQFGLEFLHAGVGSDAKFQDGIGAWIVPCQ